VHNAIVQPERAQLLYDLACAFGAQLDLDELIASVVSRCREVLDAEGASVLLLDEERNELYFPYVSERNPRVEQRLRATRFPANVGIAGAVLVSGEAKLVTNAAADPRFYGEVDKTTGIKTQSILAAPLRARRGVIGVLEVVNSSAGGSFNADDLAFLEALAGSVAVAIENAQMHGELKEREERLRSAIGALRRDLARRDTFNHMIGASEAMRELFHLMESAAASPIAVLIEGETGTGKELVARGIHQAGDRADGPFVAVNVAALSPELLESELFGHRRGAFTGALRDHRGIFEAAGGGTILLDEVGELPMPMQVKLLRVLQEGEVTPVGSTDARKVDVRVISATNSDLRTAIERGRFREDLYYRLSAFPLKVPPLRERRDDVALLADHFVTSAAERHGKRITGIDPEAFELLTDFDWPGNVRQLENEIERAVALTRDGDAVHAAILSAEVRTGAAAGPRLAGDPEHRSPPTGGGVDGGRAGGAPAGRREVVGGSPAGAGTVAGRAGASLGPGPAAANGRRSLRAARADFEARYITEALAENGGNVSRTAAALGLSRVTLQKKMKDYGLR
jgi:transcriptional regulator with GAF, ATPase, and Fis domain